MSLGRATRWQVQSGDGEAKDSKVVFSGSLTLLLDPELARQPILIQKEFQPLRAGSKRQGSRMGM